MINSSINTFFKKSLYGFLLLTQFCLTAQQKNIISGNVRDVISKNSPLVIKLSDNTKLTFFVNLTLLTKVKTNVNLISKQHYSE